MKLRHRIISKTSIFLAFTFLLLAGWFAFHLASVKEPSYQGKTFSQCLERYASEYRKSSSADEAKLNDSVTAIRAIGTNGIPILLSLLKSKDLPGTIQVERFVRPMGGKNFHIARASDKTSLAYLGFYVLGNQAEPALPALIELTKSGPYHTRRDAALSLSHIASNKEAILPTLIGLTKDPDGQLAIRCAKELVSLDPMAAQKAGVFKTYPMLKIYTPYPIPDETVNAK